MGLFSGIKSAFKKNDAAFVVNNLLKHQAKIGHFQLDTEKTAFKLVHMVWDAKPDIYNGKFGQRPHKLTVAATALAHGVLVLDDLNRNATLVALGNILSELETNWRLYPLNSLDEQLFSSASDTFNSAVSEFEDSPLAEELEAFMNTSTSQSWEEWLDEFKVVAGTVNYQLKPDENAASIVDFMDQEPLKEAYKNGVSAKSVATAFANQFDISTFGQPQSS